MPFRSETEQLRERIRRTEEEERELLVEKAALERRAAPDKRRGWITSTLVASFIACAAGYGIGIAPMSAEASRRREARARAEAEELDRERTVNTECRISLAHFEDSAARCEADRADAEKRRR